MQSKKQHEQGNRQMTKGDTPIVTLRVWRGMAGCR